MKKLFFIILYPFRGMVPFLDKALQFLDIECYLRRQGVSIGKDCRLLTRHFGSEPYLIELGNHVSVGANVQLITHDGGVWVLRHILNDPSLDIFGRISVGNNVFIGNNSIILPNVNIADNVIIAAGSVVTKSVSSNTIVAGVPAREIGSLDDYVARKKSICVSTKNMNVNEKKTFLMNALCKRH